MSSNSSSSKSSSTSSRSNSGNGCTATSATPVLDLSTQEPDDKYTLLRTNFHDLIWTGDGNHLKDKKSILLVPRFQRSYEWKSANVKGLLNDILKKIQSEQPNGLGHLELNHIILSKFESDESQHKYKIIDGQQRLTTISIILFCFINLYKETDNQILRKAVHELEDYVLVKRTDREDEIKTILQSADGDFGFKTLVKYVRNRKAEFHAEELSNFWSMFKEVEKWIREKLRDDNARLEFCTYLLTKCKFSLLVMHPANRGESKEKDMFHMTNRHAGKLFEVEMRVWTSLKMLEMGGTKTRSLAYLDDAFENLGKVADNFKLDEPRAAFLKKEVFFQFLNILKLRDRDKFAEYANNFEPNKDYSRDDAGKCLTELAESLDAKAFNRAENKEFKQLKDSLGVLLYLVLLAYFPKESLGNMIKLNDGLKLSREDDDGDDDEDDDDLLALCGVFCYAQLLVTDDNNNFPLPYKQPATWLLEPLLPTLLHCLLGCSKNSTTSRPERDPVKVSKAVVLQCLKRTQASNPAKLPKLDSAKSSAEIFGYLAPSGDIFDSFKLELPKRRNAGRKKAVLRYLLAIDRDADVHSVKNNVISELTIDHIYPQNAIKGDGSHNGFDKKTVDRMGNLMLLPKDSNSKKGENITGWQKPVLKKLDVPKYRQFFKRSMEIAKNAAETGWRYTDAQGRLENDVKRIKLYFEGVWNRGNPSSGSQQRESNSSGDANLNLSRDTQVTTDTSNCCPGCGVPKHRDVDRHDIACLIGSYKRRKLNSQSPA